MDHAWVAFWGARIVTAFSDDHIGAAVSSGQFNDAAADSHLVRFLIERRDRVGQYWFNRLNSLDRFRVEGGALRFDDLAVAGGYRGDISEYDVRVLEPSGQSVTIERYRQRVIVLHTIATTPSKVLSQMIVDVRPLMAGRQVAPVRLYLHRLDADWQLVGLRRL